MLLVAGLGKSSTGPAHGTLATTCTPGPWHIGRMLQAADAFPMNLAFAGKGNASQPGALVEDRRRIGASMRGHPRANWDRLAVITHWSELRVVVSNARERFSASRSDHPRANWDGLAVIARWSELHGLKDVEVVEIIGRGVCSVAMGSRGPGGGQPASL